MFAVRAEAQSNEDYHVEAGVSFWKPTPEIVLNTGGSSTDFDLSDIFQLEDEQFREFRVFLKPGRKHRIRFQYTPIEYAKDTVVNRTFVFQGRTFNVNVPATADFSWKLMRLGYEWDFVATDRGFVGVIGEVKLNTVEATITSTALASVAATDVKAPIPTFGGIARGYLASSVSVTAEFTGFKLTRDDFRGKFFDFDVYGMAHVGRHLGIQAGYRSLDVDYLVDEDTGVFKLKGPYFGGVLRF